MLLYVVQFNFKLRDVDVLILQLKQDHQDPQVKQGDIM